MITDYFKEFLVFSASFLLISIVRNWRKQPSLNHIAGFKSICQISDILHLKFKSPIPEVRVLAYFQSLISGMTLIFRKESMFKLRLGDNVTVFLISPKSADVLTSNKTEVSKGEAYEVGREYMGDGLVVSADNEKWRRHRRIVNPSFHAKVLSEVYMPVMNRHAKSLANSLLSKCDQKYVDIVETVDPFTFNIIMETAMGTNAEELKKVPFQRWVNMINYTWMERSFRPWLKSNSIFKQTEWGKKFFESCKGTKDYVKLIIQKRRRESESNNLSDKKRKNFLDLVMEESKLNSQEFTEDDLLDEVNTFVAAGYDTTSITTSWSLYTIGRHPEVQKKIEEELESVFADDRDRPVTTEDLSALKYLESVIKETMRLYPPIPVISRTLNNDLEIEGKIIPAGTMCVIYIWGIHRDPEYFEDPEVFNPDRVFSDKAYIPFSAGPRNCIGQKFGMLEVKIILSNILRKVRVHSLDPRDKVLYIPMTIGRPGRPLRLKISPKT